VALGLCARIELRVAGVGVGKVADVRRGEPVEPLVDRILGALVEPFAHHALLVLTADADEQRVVDLPQRALALPRRIGERGDLVGAREVVAHRHQVSVSHLHKRRQPVSDTADRTVADRLVLELGETLNHGSGRGEQTRDGGVPGRALQREHPLGRRIGARRATGIADRFFTVPFGAGTVAALRTSSHLLVCCA
jgi:hypothetical protein